MTALLDQAVALLDGTLPLRVHSARAAAWVARSALEDTLSELVRAKGVQPGNATIRTLLGCIEALYQEDAPQVASNAQYAWDGLTRASHHHAYEVAPTHAEVAALTDLVKELGSCIPGSAPSGLGNTPQPSSPSGQHRDHLASRRQRDEASGQ